MSQSAKNRSKQAILGQAVSDARRGRAQGVADDALREAGAALRRVGFNNPTLVLRWSEIVGETAGQLAEPIKLQEGRDGLVLTLKCRPGAAVLLQHETRSLIERLNAYLGGPPIVRLKLVKAPIAARKDIPDHPALNSRGTTNVPEPHPDLSGDLASALKHLAQTRKTRNRRLPD